MKKKLHKLLLILLLNQLQVGAQTGGFNYEAAIQPVDSSGFYNIVLKPEINAHLKTDHRDLRIVNDSGKWVPHLVWNPNENLITEAVNYERRIIKNERVNSNTEIIIQNDSVVITNLFFTIKNTQAERYCTLSGSDDMKGWFIINDSVKIVYDAEAQNKVTQFELRFPPVDYRYFKVIIQDNGKDALKVMRAGTVMSSTLSGKYFRFPLLENPSIKIHQKDSGNFSYIQIDQVAAYHFGRIALKLSGVKYFNRKAKLYIPSVVQHSFANPGTYITDLDLSNNSTLQFNVPLSKATTFYIIIQNEDNLPLKVDEIKTFTGYRVATVYLEKGHQYKMLLENEALSIPKYDLAWSDIPSREKIPVAAVAVITAVKRADVIVKKNNSGFLLWGIIGIAVAVLGFFTYRLISDMNQSKS